MHLYLLIDHDNIPWAGVTVERLVRLALDALMDKMPAGLVDVTIRAYGGWFDGNLPTLSRERASAFYQEECPSLIEHGSMRARIAFEFADELLAGTADSTRVRIRNTYQRRRSKQTAVPDKSAPICADPHCELKSIRRWLKKNSACSKSGCAYNFQDFYVRPEQKQVDIHLALDLMTICQGHMSLGVAVATDDVDLIPAIAAATINKTSVVIHLRFETPQTYLDYDLVAQDLRIVQALGEAP